MKIKNDEITKKVIDYNDELFSDPDNELLYEKNDYTDSEAIDALSCYLRDISELNPLSTEEQLKLAKIKATCKGKEAEEARATLIRTNLKLVVHVAKGYKDCGVPFIDIIEEGNIGLIKAVDKYDYRKGLRFSTYAVWWIIQSILKGFEENSLIRLPCHVHNKITKIKKAQLDYLWTNGRYPTDAELEEITGIKAQYLDVVKSFNQELLSLDSPIYQESGDVTLMELISYENDLTPEQHSELVDVRETINEALMKLNKKQKQVIEMRYGLDDGVKKTLGEVGEKLNLTKERIRQIERNALKLLKVYLT